MGGTAMRCQVVSTANPLSDSGGHEHRVARLRRQERHNASITPNTQGKEPKRLGQTPAGGQLPGSGVPFLAIYPVRLGVNGLRQWITRR